MAESPIDITLERLNRLEKLVTERFDAIDKRFDGIESSIGKMVTVLEAHDHTVRARTEDTARMADIERRLDALERRQPRT